MSPPAVRDRALAGPVKITRSRPASIGVTVDEARTCCQNDSMAVTIDQIPLLEDHFDTSFGDQRWDDSGQSRSSSWFLGDDPCGPMVYFLDSAKPASEGPRFPVHHHDSDELRLVITGALRVGRTWMPPGHFRMQAANHDYGPETTGPDGCQEIVLFSDRRGFIPEYPNARDAEALGWLSGLFARQYAGFIPERGEGQIGPRYSSLLAGSETVASRHGHVDSSFDDPSWRSVGGLRYSYWAMGPVPLRPLILLIEAAPGAALAPPVKFRTDLLRLVLAGSSDIGGQTYGPGDIRIQQAGHFLGPEAAGPAGRSWYSPARATPYLFSPTRRMRRMRRGLADTWPTSVEMWDAS
jgi:hypothetical protein